MTSDSCFKELLLLFLFLYIISALPAACSSYTELNSTDRHVNYSTTSAQCDSRMAVKWYRFTGAGGTTLPETCPAERHCNTNATGWLNGRHPTVAEGEVIRTVCYSWNGSCCNQRNSIKVKSCGYFYVYELQPSPVCASRYCSTHAGKPC